MNSWFSGSNIFIKRGVARHEVYMARLIRH
jgi:hypothetical protein